MVPEHLPPKWAMQTRPSDSEVLRSIGELILRYGREFSEELGEGFADGWVEKNLRTLMENRTKWGLSEEAARAFCDRVRESLRKGECGNEL